MSSSYDIQFRKVAHTMQTLRRDKSKMMMMIRGCCVTTKETLPLHKFNLKLNKQMIDTSLNVFTVKALHKRESHPGNKRLRPMSLIRATRKPG